jgi:hypothetical protein
MLRYLSHAIAAAELHPALVTKLSEPPEGLVDRIQPHGPNVVEKYRQLCDQRTKLIDRYEAAVQDTERLHARNTGCRSTRASSIAARNQGFEEDSDGHRPWFPIENPPPQLPRRETPDPDAKLAIKQDAHEHKCRGPKNKWCDTCFTKRQSKTRGRAHREGGNTGQVV